MKIIYKRWWSQIYKIAHQDILKVLNDKMCNCTKSKWNQSHYKHILEESSRLSGQFSCIRGLLVLEDSY